MSRPRTPTVILEAKGSFRHDPQRRREDPAPQGEFGEPPSRWYGDDNERGEMLRDIWREIAASVPVGVLTKADRFTVEIACELLLTFRMFGVGGDNGLSTGMLTQLNNILSKLGCTPVDRARVATTPSDKDKEELAEFD